MTHKHKEEFHQQTIDRMGEKRPKVANNMIPILKKAIYLSITGFFLFVLNGCGGGIDGTGGPPSGTASRSVSVGVITSNNEAISVNGINYNTENTEIIIDGENISGNTSAFSVGEIIAVEGNINEDQTTGTAERIIKNTNLRGPISSINTEEETLVVLEQQIIINDDTILGNTITSLNGLNVGDMIQVSGFPLANGDLSSTRIEESSNTNYSILGEVTLLNLLENKFSINDLRIDFSGISAPSGLANNMVVEVRGAMLNDDGELVATEIRIISSLLSGDFDFVELEGFVTEFTSVFEFEINGVTILTNRQTEFAGNIAESLGLNSKVEIEGTLTDEGAIQADTVRFLTAEITNFANYSALTSTRETFTWNNVDADEYRLRIKTVFGEDRIVHDEYYDGNTFSAIVDGLPRNSAYLEVILSTRHDSHWSHRLFLFMGQGVANSAELIGYSKDDVLESDNVTFSWPDVDADEYRLIIVNNGNTLYDNSFDGTILSANVTGLPRNKAYLEIDLMTRHDDWWVTESYRIFSHDALPNATLSSHVDDGRISGSTETFTWNDANADAYELEIISHSDEGRLFYSEQFSGDTTAVTIENLPLNNSSLGVYLRTNHDGFWSQESYFISGAGVLADAELTSHSSLEQLQSDQATFIWSEIEQAEEYEIIIRAAENAGEGRRTLLEEDYDNYITSLTIGSLPRNSAPFSITLRTRQQGWWGENSYYLHGANILDNAELTSHNDGQSLSSTTETFTWSDVGADRYQIVIYDDGEIIYRENFSQTNSATVSNIPIGNPEIKVRLLTDHDGWWYGETYYFTSQ
jgi:hypothetical protein